MALPLPHRLHEDPLLDDLMEIECYSKRTYCRMTLPPPHRLHEDPMLDDLMEVE